MFPSTSRSAASQFQSHRSSTWRSFRSRRTRRRQKDGWLSSFRFLSPQDLIVVCAALVVLYLITGDNAELVCDTFTSLPPAVFTYQLLTNPKATTVAYEATLCFWILHGTLVIFDHLLRKTVWYFLAKFLLMAAVFSHVMAKCKSDDGEDNPENVAEPIAVQNVTMSSLSSMSVMPESTSATAIKTKKPRKRISPRVNRIRVRNCGSQATPKRRQLSAANNNRGSSSIDPLVIAPITAGDHKNDIEANGASFPLIDEGMRTQYTPRTQYFQSLSEKFTPPDQRLQQLQIGSAEQHDMLSKAIQTSSAISTFTLTAGEAKNNDAKIFGDSSPPPPCPTFIRDEGGQEDSQYNNPVESNSKVRTDESEKSTYASVTMSSDDSDNDDVKKAIYNGIREHLVRNGSLACGDMASICTFSTARKTIDLVEESFERSLIEFPLPEDLIVGKKELVFRRPYQNVLTLSLANSSTNKNIVWEIKTNASRRVFIAPNRGILAVGTMLKICLNVRGEENSETAHKDLSRVITDRLAIDYVLVESEYVNFDDDLFMRRGAVKMRKNLKISYK